MRIWESNSNEHKYTIKARAVANHVAFEVDFDFDKESREEAWEAVDEIAHKLHGVSSMWITEPRKFPLED